MHFKISIICSVVLLLFMQCVSENVEEKYASQTSVTRPEGEIAWFPLNGNLNDSTGNQTLISVAGPVEYAEGINDDTGMGLLLNGVNNYLILSPGLYDSIAVLFWLKTSGTAGIVEPNRPVMFDYGSKAVSATLTDAVSGATQLSVQHGATQVSTSEMGEENYLNTHNAYSLFYFEVTKQQAAFTFQGYANGMPHKVTNQYAFTDDLLALSDLIYIGRSSDPHNADNSFFKGYIDEIHVFSRFLTSEELTHYLNIQPN